MVKNRQKILGYFMITVLLLVQGCKSKQVISNDADVIVFDNDTTHIENVETLPNENTEELIEDESLIAETDSTSKEEREKVVKKSKYTVAIVLPFMEDSVRTKWLEASKDDFKEFETPNASEIAISFYEGFLMALQEMSLSSKFEIKVYDTKLDNVTTQKIADKILLEDIDIIIGPYLSENISIITEMAKLKNIAVVSPFSPSTKAASNYENYYMVEPSFQKHLETMINFGMNEIINSHLKYIYQKNSFGQKNAKYFSMYIDSANANKPLENQILYSIIEEEKDEVKDFKLSKNIDNNKNNILIINSFDENFLSVFLQKLSEFKEDTNIVSFGMPGWENSQILRMSHLSNNKIHFTTSSWIFENETKARIDDLYKDRYKKTASEDVYLGYDMASIFIPLIDQKGLNFSSTLCQESYSGLNRNYSFRKTPNEEKTIRIENGALHVYKIENFERILVK